jgi:hypothetical protein
MSQWVEIIRSHRVWGLLESIGPAIDKALERELLTVEAIDSLERLRFILAFCGKRLAATEPILVLPATVENLANYLTQLKSYIDIFISNGDVGQLNAANVQADGILANVINVPGSATVDDLTIISEAASSYRATLEKHLKDALTTQQMLAERGQANEAKIASLEAAITTEQQRLASLVTEQQSEFSQAQDKRASEFSAAQNENLSKFTTASTEFQTQFSADQDFRKTAFSELQLSASEKIATLITNYTTQLSEQDKIHLEKERAAADTHRNALQALENSYSKKAGVILEQIEIHKKNVESLVGIIGNLGVTSGYLKVANHARIMLYVWQLITIVALACLIFVAVLEAFPAAKSVEKGSTITTHMVTDVQSTKPFAKEDKGGSNKDPDIIKPEAKASISLGSATGFDSDFYHGLATRIFLALTFGIFAGYAGRQASHFMEIEKKNRKLALELEALGPFIEPLQQIDRDKFRVQVGDRSFGVPDNDSCIKKEDDPVTALAVMKSKEIQEFLTNLIKETVKAVKP